MGEEGVDTGGLTREFFSILERSVSPKYITEKGVLIHDSVALQVYLLVSNLLLITFWLFFCS